MFTAIRSSQRPTTLITRVTAALADLPHPHIQSSRRPRTLITRVTAALPDVPHPHRKRPRRVGAPVIVGAVAGLVAVLIGIAAVIFRDKLASIMSRGDGGEEQALVAAQERGDGAEAEAPVAAQD